MSDIALSVIVITKNEAHDIADCLESAAFADELVVVDSSSVDGTAALAQASGARVLVTAGWPGFGAQKNRALAEARGRWVLSLDADERLSPDLAAQIRAVVADRREGGPAAFELLRRSSFCGQWMRHGDWSRDRVVRLFRRGAGRFSDDLVHERLVVDGAVARLSGTLLHHTMRNLDEALDKMNRYSTGRAVDRLRAGGRGGLAAALFHGAWAFVRGYIVRLGFLDGRLGLVLAVCVAEGTYYRYLKMRWPIGATAAD